MDHVSSGTVYLVGAGPGDPGLPTGGGEGRMAVRLTPLATMDECLQELAAAGRAPSTPCAVMQWGPTASQVVVESTVAGIGAAVADAGLKTPLVVVVGDGVDLRRELRWLGGRPLAGKRILATRRSPGPGGFAQWVRTLGGDLLEAPVTEHRAVEGTGQEAVERALADLSSGHFNWVLLASANAVEFTFRELERLGLDGRVFAGTRVACVGEATAKALAGHSLHADMVPERGNALALSQEILRTVEAGSIRALVPRADGGRDEGIELLREAGAAVTAVSVYRTMTSRADTPDLESGLRRLRRGEVDILALFAPSQVRALVELLGERAQDLLSSCPVVAAIGKTTANVAIENGLTVEVVPDSPGAEAFARALADHCDKTGL